MCLSAKIVFFIYYSQYLIQYNDTNIKARHLPEINELTEQKKLTQHKYETKKQVMKYDKLKHEVATREKKDEKC